MAVFGRNLLSEAFSVIPHINITLLRFDSSTVKNNGLIDIEYKDPETIEAIVQPVPTAVYKQLNLDFQKRYIYVHTLTQLHSILDQDAPDRLVVDSKLYDVYEISDWFEYDGWTRAMAVEVDRVH